MGRKKTTKTVPGEDYRVRFRSDGSWVVESFRVVEQRITRYICATEQEANEQRLFLMKRRMRMLQNRLLRATRSADAEPEPEHE